MTKSLERNLNNLINPKVDRLSGTIGLSSSIINVPSRPGFVWVRLLDNLNEPIYCHNDKVAPVFGMPVIVEYKNNRYEIIGRDDVRYSDWKSDSAFLPPHGLSHSAMLNAGGGGDVVWVDSRQFLPFLVLPSGIAGTQAVTVSQSIFRNLSGDWIVGGNTGTPNYPHTSSDTMYLLMMKDSDGSLYSLPGSSNVPATVTGTFQTVPYIPKLLASNVDHPLAAIRTRNTGTTIGWDQIIDVRELFSRSQAVAYTPIAHTTTHAIGGSDILPSRNILYVNTGSSLVSTNVNSAIDELGTTLGTLGVNVQDLTAQVTGTNTTFTFTPACSSIMVLIDGVMQKPSTVTFVPHTTSFSLSFVPETGANLLLLRVNSIIIPPTPDPVVIPQKIASITTVQTRTQGLYISPVTGDGTEIAPLTLVMTPVKAGNVVILEWVINSEVNENSVFIVTRNGTRLTDTTNATNNRWAGIAVSNYDTNLATTPTNQVIKIIDYSSLAVATTYRLHTRSANATQNTLYLNRGATSAGADGQEALLSTAIATEVNT